MTDGQFEWVNTQRLPARRYICGYCGADVSSQTGYVGRHLSERFLVRKLSLYLCHNCGNPSFFEQSHCDELLRQVPGFLQGEEVAALPKPLEILYDEARRCFQAGAYTAAVMCCKKIVMHVAVAQGLSPPASFPQHIDYLMAQHYIPPHSETWVEQIRQKVSEENHEIALRGLEDAKDLITFTAMLLKFLYEFPAKMPQSKVSSSSQG